jgi:2-oxo-4-hydroxy-4-carboxy-5-ureidoimidazoline decarboxylase
MNDTLQSFQVYRNLALLNELPAKEAEAAFLKCCGSSKWAGQMTLERPFNMLDDLFVSAEALWFSSTPAEWREAFSPDQLSVNGDLGKELDEAMTAYEEKFGFAFIIFTDGLSGTEILASCKARTLNAAATEIRIAAREQYKITEKELSKLLEK